MENNNICDVTVDRVHGASPADFVFGPLVGFMWFLRVIVITAFVWFVGTVILQYMSSQQDTHTC